MELAETATETAQFEQMKAEQPIVETPVETPKPEAEPAPKPEVAAEAPKPEVKPETPKGEGRDVPLPVLLEERQKRKAAEAALAELRKTAQAPAPNKPEPVDPATDPIAVIQAQQKWIDDREKQDLQHREMNQFQQTVIAREQEYVKDNPDYPKAVEFLKEARVREMREGLGMNDQQIAQTLSQEAYQTAQYAMQNDLNPADIFMRLAKARGFTAEAPEPEAAPAPVAVVPQPEAVARLAAIGKGQRAGKGLSNGGGGPAAPAPSLEAIANLEGADFDAAWKTGQVKRMMS